MSNAKSRRAEKRRRQRENRESRGNRDSGRPWAPPPPSAPPPDSAQRRWAAEQVAAVERLGMAKRNAEAERIVAELAACIGADGTHLGAAAVEETLVQRVRVLWPRGWQPADVERWARAEFGSEAAAVVVDVIAAEHAERPGRRVDPRWAAQLDRLDARVWWDTTSRDTPYPGRLLQWADKAGHTVADALRLAIDVSALLLLAPPLTLWMPYPDAPGDVLLRFAWSVAVPETIDRKMLERVRALLAKAESTTFPEEAEAFMAKAQELMSRYSIDQAFVSAQAGAGAAVPTGRRIGIDDPYASAKAILVTAVAKANGCRAIWSKELGFAEVVGFETELDIVELLTTSLLVQAAAAMAAEGRKVYADGASRTRSFRQSFLVAFAQRIGERLREAAAHSRTEAAHTHGAALVPVLARREEAVRATVEERFPHLRTSRTTSSDREGWAAGRRAADRASLGRGGERHLEA